MAASDFALYLHVPYCRHVCPYCDFNVYARPSPPAEDDATAFLDEMAAWRAQPPWSDGAVRTLYIGGGTPSLFSPAVIGRIVDGAARVFGLRPDAEVTLEANPGTVTAASLANYRAAGVNRLSLGVQSFSDAVLRTLGRDHTGAEARDAIGAARDAGIANVSVDLIYGVPGQTLASWRSDLRATVMFDPPHVSTYALTYEPGTPFTAWRASGRLTPTGEDDDVAMSELLLERLAEAGYEHYEISSHARPGHASRHNLAYWDGSSYLGIGPGAHSFASVPPPGRRWSNERHPQGYRRAVADGGRAIASEEVLTRERATLEFVVMGLRRIAGIDTRAFAARFDAPLEVVFPQLANLERDGLVCWGGGRLRLTSRGLRFADSVSAALV